MITCLSTIRPPARFSYRRTVAGVAALCATLLLASPTPASAGAGTDHLTVNETLGTNASLYSPKHTYETRMQGDGNLVVYGPNGAVWSSNTRGNNAHLVMQGDSNLVMYSDQGVLFATGKARAGSNRLVMQDDGNLVLYGSNDIWASKNSSERAIQWYYNHVGDTSYEGRCETAVENAFGTSGRYLYAAAAASRRPSQYRIDHSNWNQRAQRTPYTDAPRGALVFYDTSIDGHVAISLGNGQIITSAAPGKKIGIASISWFAPAPGLGWAYAPW